MTVSKAAFNTSCMTGHIFTSFLNPLPDLPILSSSNSMANKDTMSKIWTNGDTVT